MINFYVQGDESELEKLIALTQLLNKAMTVIYKTPELSDSRPLLTVIFNNAKCVYSSLLLNGATSSKKVSCEETLLRAVSLIDITRDHLGDHDEEEVEEEGKEKKSEEEKEEEKEEKEENALADNYLFLAINGYCWLASCCAGILSSSYFPTLSHSLFHFLLFLMCELGRLHEGRTGAQDMCRLQGDPLLQRRVPEGGLGLS